jgi:choline dehydrogenase-like flavoprotein
MYEELDKWDTIIVGAGGSGAVLASQLTKLCIDNILVLEMGKNHGNDILVTDASRLFTADSRPDITEEFLTQRDPNIGGARTNVGIGRGWGGSTANYYMYAIRPSQTYLTQISVMMNISVEILNGYFQSIERYVPRPGGIIDPSRGTNGPVIVTQLPLGSTVFNAGRVDIVNVANDLFPMSNGIGDLLSLFYGVTPLEFPNNDYNATSSPQNFLVNMYQSFISDTSSQFVRQEVGTNFLTNDIVTPNGLGVNGHNIRIIDRTRVTKIRLRKVDARCKDEYCTCGDKVRPYAVDAWVDNTCCTFFLRRNLILAAGAIETPALLQRSGIGPASILDPLCIKKEVVNEHVGRHALTHPGFRFTYWIEEDLNDRMGPDYAAMESLLSLNGMLPNVTLSTNLPTSIYPTGYTPQRAVQLLSSSGGPGPDLKWTCSFSWFNMLPRNEGRIEIVAKDAFTKPNIFLDIFTTDEERMAAIQDVRDIAGRVTEYVVAYNSINVPNLLVTWPYGDPATLTDAVIYNIYIAPNVIKKHITGTARMGSMGNGVIDTDFQVFGTHNLYITDLSVLPLIPDANTEWMAMVLGMHLAERLSEKCKKRVYTHKSLNCYTPCRIVICNRCNIEPCHCQQDCYVKQFVECKGDT